MSMPGGGAAASSATLVGLEAMKVTELRSRCAALGERTDGRKVDLVARLYTGMMRRPPPPPPNGGPSPRCTLHDAMRKAGSIPITSAQLGCSSSCHVTALVGRAGIPRRCPKPLPLSSSSSCKLNGLDSDIVSCIARWTAFLT